MATWIGGLEREKEVKLLPHFSSVSKNSADTGGHKGNSGVPPQYHPPSYLKQITPSPPLD